MHTLMIASMDQGKGLAEEALRPVELFDKAARLAAALKAFARAVKAAAAVAPFHTARV